MWGQELGNLAKGYVAGQIQKKLPEEIRQLSQVYQTGMGGLLNALVGGPAPAATTAQPSAGVDQTTTAAPAIDQTTTAAPAASLAGPEIAPAYPVPGTEMPAGVGLPETVTGKPAPPSAATAPSTTLPATTGAELRRQIAAGFMIDPTGTVKTLLEKRIPAVQPIEALLDAAGIRDPALRSEIIQGQIAKERYIPPTAFRPGTVGRLPSGEWVAPPPELVTATVGAGEAAKRGWEPRDITDAATGQTYRFFPSGPGQAPTTGPVVSPGGTQGGAVPITRPEGTYYPVGQPSGTKEFQVGQTKGTGERYQLLVPQAQAAQQIQDALRNVYQISLHTPTGPGAEKIAHIKGIIGTLGNFILPQNRIAEPTPTGDVEKDYTANYQILTKYASQILQQANAAGGGQMTDARMAYFLSGVPEPGERPAALQYIARYMAGAQGVLRARYKDLFPVADNPQALAKAEFDWSNNFDPRAFQAATYSPVSPGKDPRTGQDLDSPRNAYYKSLKLRRGSPEDQKFRAALTKANDVVPILQ
jgi:hypothetical protein